MVEGVTVRMPGQAPQTNPVLLCGPCSPKVRLEVLAFPVAGMDESGKALP